MRKIGNSTEAYLVFVLKAGGGENKDLGGGGGKFGLIFREDTWDKIKRPTCLLRSLMTELHIATLTLSDLQRFAVLGRPWAVIPLEGCSLSGRGLVVREVGVCLRAVTVETAHIS